MHVKGLRNKSQDPLAALMQKFNTENAARLKLVNSNLPHDLFSSWLVFSFTPYIYRDKNNIMEQRTSKKDIIFLSIIGVNYNKSKNMLFLIFYCCMPRVSFPLSLLCAVRV